MDSTIPEEYCSLDMQFEQEVLDRLSRLEKLYDIYWLDLVDDEEGEV
jgi:hypothetical protein